MNRAIKQLFEVDRLVMACRESLSSNRGIWYLKGIVRIKVVLVFVGGSVRRRIIFTTKITLYLFDKFFRSFFPTKKSFFAYYNINTKNYKQ